MKTFGDRLREQREKNGLSQRDVAALMGCSGNTIGNYELGKTYPTKEFTEKLAELYGVTYDSLMKIEPEEKPVRIFTAPKQDFPGVTQVKAAWADELPPKKEEPAPMPSPIKKDDAVVYRAEDGRKLDDINLIIRHLRDMHITDEEKKRLHKRLSQMRTEVESIVLFGE